MKNSIQKPLLAWYEKEKRDLPWRHTNDPYAIWVSEIMLQQTQVDTVIPYYTDWIKQFPTIKKLAQAKEEKVLKQWEGLGYYSRARNLHKAAKVVTEQFNGIVPNKPEELLKLPGIGPYSLGAISSIAFNLPIAAVDGNVLRVVSRLFAIEKNIKDKACVEQIRELVTNLFPKTKRSEMTQAWMELGALICLPTNPKCLICPLQKACVAKQKNLTASLPIVDKRPKIKKVITAAVILEQKGQILLEKRPVGKVMGGLWLFPTVELPGSLDEFQKQIPDFFEKTFGLNVSTHKQVLTLSHSYTIHRAQLNVFSGKILSHKKHNNNLNWISKKRLKETPFPSVHAKIANFVLN